jgi:hypothetical protein
LKKQVRKLEKQIRDLTHIAWQKKKKIQQDYLIEKYQITLEEFQMIDEFVKNCNSKYILTALCRNLEN